MTGETAPETENRIDRVGLMAAISCQALWGFICILWRLLSTQSALYLLASRMIWACVFMLLLCVLVKKTRFMYLFKDKRARRFLLASALLTSVNWGIYIWAANSGHLLETSIGYYLCPLLTIFFGPLVFHERLTRMQKIACVLAAIGVASFIFIEGGSIWVSFTIAITFAAYGAVKKRGGYPATAGMAVESIFNAIVGLAIFGVAAVFPGLWDLVPATPDAMAVTSPMAISLLIMLAGVLTAAPLLLYSAAANRISMVANGFVQYVSPTIELALAVTLFGEAFTLGHGVCLTFAWMGIAILSIEMVTATRRARQLYR